MNTQAALTSVDLGRDDDVAALDAELHALIDRFTTATGERRQTRAGCTAFLSALMACPGSTWQARWNHFEHTIWPCWLAADGRSPLAHWMAGPRALVLARRVTPTWTWLASVPFQRWIARLPTDHEWRQAHDQLRSEVASISWKSRASQDKAVSVGLRLLIARGYTALQEITDNDLAQIPSGTRGQDGLDVALCRLGIVDRTPQRGTSRRSRRPRRTVAELVAMADVPAPFTALTLLYLETYATRVSQVYVTLRHKLIALGHFWRFLAERYPEISTSADVVPAHGRAYIPYAIARARERQRGEHTGADVRPTAHVWLLEVRTFFADICTWATEPDSPFAPHAPRVVPLMRRDLLGIGFEKARARTHARITATVLDLEREMPTIRACALQHWRSAGAALQDQPGDRRATAAEAATFWDWALVELLVQSGLRLEEASELTTLDILKRQLADGRVYYLLHIKPSKFDRARVIPIGDGLGRVIAEIIRHVKRFYGSEAVPACDHWDHHERQPRPRAPYLLQGAKHPSALGIQTIRGRLRALSVAAGARRADGRPLILLPHDCRRVFASEHLNNNVPVHVIQALLGHATLDTVMVYAKLYPSTMIEEYRKAVRGLYNAFHGDDSFRNPTAEEWSAFTVSCSLRDMGTHLCALPTGEYCPKGLVCLGCTHAQPKQSAAPIFRRMLASHERALGTAHARGEPAGQIAARQLEVSRIGHALRRAEDLPSDVAAAIEAEAGPG
jgi:integrase